MSEVTEETPGPVLPVPSPLLRGLEPFVGTWDFKGHLVGSGDEAITARSTFAWLPGGFFMQQRITIDFLGMSIESLELIGYDAGIDGLTSSVFSNLAPDALPYFWNVSGKNVEVKVNYGLLHATFTGEFGEDGNQYSGGWRPSPGADPAVNVAYDLSGVRVG